MSQNEAKNGIVVFGFNTMGLDGNFGNPYFAERFKDALEHKMFPVFFSDKSSERHQELVNVLEMNLNLKSMQDFQVYARPKSMPENDPVEVKVKQLEYVSRFAAAVGTRIVGAFDACQSVIDSYKAMGLESAFLLNSEGTDAPLLTNSEKDAVLDEMSMFMGGVDKKDEQAPPAVVTEAAAQEVKDFDPELVPRLGVDVPVSSAHLYPKYFKKIPEDWEYLDVYAVHELFQIDDHSGALQHADKKILLRGVRTGGKSDFNDIREARDTLNRWLEINAHLGA